MPTPSLIRSRILHFPEPHTHEPEYLDDGVLVLNGDRVERVLNAREAAPLGLNLEHARHLPEQLILPGFIDTHVHSPQLEVMACFGEQLLDWLNNYTFPAEQKYADEAYASEGAEFFIEACLSHGTTTPMVYTTSHKQAADAVFSKASEINMRLIAGKVLMDRNAPEALTDTAESGFNDSRELILKWHGKGRLGYAITPRFSGTSSPAQLASVSRLHREFPDTWVQTHLSENLSEIAWLKSIFPEARDYLDTYEQFDIHNERTIFAHCLHLSESELSRMAERGGKIAFCPTSNLFLGSGLFDLQKIRSYGIPVSIASDVGGGTSLCQLRTLGEAYKICQLQGYSMHPFEAFYMVTRGNAEVLQLDDCIGDFLPGKEADFIVLDAGKHALIQRRVQQATSIEEELFIYMTMGDDRLISETWVAGQRRYRS